MSLNPLFNFKDGKVSITDHTRTIWYYNNIIEKYGEHIALKLFIVLHYVADLSPDNPFHDISENEKLETIISGICPEIVLEIDWNDYEIIDAIEYTRKLYETKAYRKYLASKSLWDKLSKKVYTTYVDLTKADGNSGEIQKAFKLFSEIGEQMKKDYEEFVEELGVRKMRGGITDKRVRDTDGKEKELE